MMEALQPIPTRIATRGEHSHRYFTSEGRLRSSRRLSPMPLEWMLHERYQLPAEEARGARLRRRAACCVCLAVRRGAASRLGLPTPGLTAPSPIPTNPQALALRDFLLPMLAFDPAKRASEWAGMMMAERRQRQAGSGDASRQLCSSAANAPHPSHSLQLLQAPPACWSTRGWPTTRQRPQPPLRPSRRHEALGFTCSWLGTQSHSHAHTTPP